MDKLKLFVIWLDGYIEACGTELNIHQTNVVRNKLNDLFQHEAEPVEEKPILEELGEKHDFHLKPILPNGLHGRDEDGIVYRC
jgi:hypothetical protein